MRRFDLVLTITCLLSSLAMAQKQDWLPVGPQEWQVKDVPGDPGASAIQLYYAEHIDDPDGTKFVYRRIKILSEKALQPKGPADVEILVPPDCSVADLKARTLHPDGTIVDFAGKPFEKVVIKRQGLKFLAKTFTFPQVTVGSILEYKYVLNSPANRVFLVSEWEVQHDLFTTEEHLTMRPYLEGLRGFIRGYEVSAVSTNLPKDLKLEKKNGGWTLNAHNLPAFQTEAYMPPENSYKPEVHFFYITYQPESDDRYWRDLGKTMYEESERFIGSHGEVKQAAAETIAGESSPEGKLRKLYLRVQQIRNLSFERSRSEEEEKKESLQQNENAAEVLNRGYGFHNEINRVFVGMARATGFEVSLLAASNRKEGFFAKGVLSRSQVNTEIAMVNLNGHQLYLDPGTRFCPFGLLPWEQTSTQALKLDKKGGELVLVPPATQDKAVVQRIVNASLDSTGTLKGEIAIQYLGSAALERRLTALKTDDAGKKKMLEDELKHQLAPDAIVKIKTSQGWESREEPLVASFSVEIPGYASLTGKRFLIPGYLFRTQQLRTFKESQRRFPVYFPFAFSELDQISIGVPAGYRPEGIPADQDAGLPYAKCQIRSQFSGSQMLTQRKLLFNGIFFPLERYSELRGFFSKVAEGDDEQAVLQGTVANAQTSN